ncbi:caspase family protein [Bacillus mycoides]|nr:caspase family protein [Bacillus mycoides]
MGGYVMSTNNLAIILGVSDYIDGNNLPGCKNDANIIYQLVKQTEKYQDILFLESNTNSDNVKEKVSQFIQKHSEMEKVNEIFFYYTGHGLFNKGEFHFVLSDYNEQWLNRTTYKNSEIDDLLKSLDPKLTVKVIDACHSGVRYVKEVNDSEVSKMFTVTKEKFNNCYFMFSSQFDESSWATQKISYFTQSFVNSIIEHKVGNIRYRDIIDYISDDFLRKDITQTPYYVIQSTNTEVFCTIDEKTKAMLNSVLKSFDTHQVEEENKETTNTLTFLEIVKKDAENYCNDIEEVRNLLEKINGKINDLIVTDELNELYDINAIFEHEIYDDIPNINAVARYLENKSNEFFIELNYTKRTVKTPIKTYYDTLAEMMGKYEAKQTKFKEETIDVIDYYNISEDNVPYTTITIDFEPKLPNLSMYNCTIIYAFSKIHINLFYSYNIYNEVSWGEYELNNVEWIKTEELIIKQEESVLEKIESIERGFITFIEKDLYDRFKKALETARPIKEESDESKKEERIEVE